MSYTALYRKFRPQTFDEVKGQDEIVTILKNQIISDRIGHAYIFTGTRGTGKTSLAKIFARAVNCEHPVNGSPCGECPSCRAAAAGSMNVIELDAASNNGVDNVRDIIDDVQYPPVNGRFKVYIIDEVHMLSASAFNALLKTLEEPPEYVIFILATTEIQKVPLTILSRCQRYDFHRISLTTVTERLSEIMDREGVKYEKKALSFIARKGDGSMRDALSLLDECISFYFGEPLTFEHTLEVLGAVDTDTFTKLFTAISEEDVPACLDISEKLSMSGMDLGQFAADFTWYLRNLLLIKADPAAAGMLDVSESDAALMKETADGTEEEILFRLIDIMMKLSADLKYASSKRVLFETTLIKLCHPETEKTYDALVARVAALEKQVTDGAVLQRKNSTAIVNADEEAPKPKLIHIPLTADEKERNAAVRKAFAEAAAGLHPLEEYVDDMKIHYDKEHHVIRAGVKSDKDKMYIENKESDWLSQIMKNVREITEDQDVRIEFTVDQVLAGNDDELVYAEGLINPALLKKD